MGVCGGKGVNALEGRGGWSIQKILTFEKGGGA